MAGRRSGPSRQLLPALKAGFALVVGASAALMSLAGDASPLTAAGAGLAGLVVGAVLVWIAFPSGQASGRGRGRDGGNDW